MERVRAGDCRLKWAFRLPRSIHLGRLKVRSVWSILFIHGDILVLSFMKSLTFVDGIMTLFVAGSGRVAIHTVVTK